MEKKGSVELDWKTKANIHIYKGIKKWKENNTIKTAVQKCFPDTLLDLVEICNIAHRRGCGDFVWCQWSGLV